MNELEHSIKNCKERNDIAKESKLVRALRRELAKECEMCGVAG